MDNQTSPELRHAATALQLTIEYVSAKQKEANRAERAIQTAKHHIIATRAGFHRDCPHVYLDKCLVQIEITLNTIHPYEYDPRVSAYQGIYGEAFDFMRHPIAPAGSKVLTWNSPDTRGTWDDHGSEGIYLGPALQHFRAFRIWVSQHSALRVSSTVWWFFQSCVPDDNLITLPNQDVSYPPTRDRPHPKPDGSDLLGRFFFEPDLGVCCLTRMGPIREKKMQSRALRSIPNADPAIPLGFHYTLYYKCVATNEEHFSSLDEICEWIRNGPILQPPSNHTSRSPYLTSPPYSVPAQDPPATNPYPERAAPISSHQPLHTQGRSDSILRKSISIPEPPSASELPAPIAETSQLPTEPRRQSTRKRLPRDLLKPQLHGKTYSALPSQQCPRKQRVPTTLEFPERQRVSQPALKRRRYEFAMGDNTNFPTTLTKDQYRKMYSAYRQIMNDKYNTRIGWSDMFKGMSILESKFYSSTCDYDTKRHNV